MRLIDAEALEDSLGVEDDDIAFKEILCDAPTVGTIPVRCGECRFYHPECPYENFCIAQKMNDPKPDDFCSYGERKDGEK